MNTASTINEIMNTTFYQPYGTYNGLPFDANSISSIVVYSIDVDNGYPLMAAGISKASSSHSSHMPGYPNRDISHWIVIVGYSDYGNSAVISDPAKSPAVSWSSSISAMYTVSMQKLASFAGSRGIIW